MLQMYSYVANRNKNIGFQKLSLRLDGNNPEFTPGGGKMIWTLLENIGCRVLCAKTDKETVFFLFKDIVSDGANGENWDLNFAIEADQESAVLWQKTLAAFLTNYRAETEYFAQSLKTRETEGKAYYEFDSHSYMRHLMQIVDVRDSIKILEKDHHMSKKENKEWNSIVHLLRQLQENPFEWISGLYLLVPIATERYFFDYCGWQFKDNPSMVISKESWLVLVEHKRPVQKNKKDERSARTETKSEKNMMIGAVIAVIAVIFVFFICAGICCKLSRKCKNWE